MHRGAGGHGATRRAAGRCSSELISSPRLPSSLTTAFAARSRHACIEIASPGPPDVLRPVERPDPIPAAGEVLIRVAAAGVNRPDVMQRQGAYPPPPGASDIPGLEVAGTIESCGDGDDVSGWRVGDRVCALVAGGGYATLCVAPGAAVPAGAGVARLSSPPRRCRRRSSRSGPTSSIAGDCARARRRSFTAARAASARRRFSWPRRAARASSRRPAQTRSAAPASELGAERAINYRTEDFVEAVRDADRRPRRRSDPRHRRRRYVARNLAALAMDGRLVQIGLMEGEPTATVDLGACSAAD